MPLAVFEDDEFIELTEVNSKLRNALVEIQFSINHVFLRSQNPPADSFRANIEQIVILKRGRPSRSAQHNPRAGPISAIQKRSQTSSTGNKERATKKKRTADDGKEQRDSKGKQKEVNNDRDVMEGSSGSK